MDPIDKTGAGQAPLTADQQASLKKLHDAATQLEGVFVGLLFKEMRNAAPPTTIFGKVSEQQKTFNEMLDTARANEIGKSGAFGFARAIEAQLRNAVLGTKGPIPSADGTVPPAGGPVSPAPAVPDQKASPKTETP